MNMAMPSCNNSHYREQMEEFKQKNPQVRSMIETSQPDLWQEPNSLKADGFQGQPQVEYVTSNHSPPALLSLSQLLEDRSPNHPGAQNTSHLFSLLDFTSPKAPKGLWEVITQLGPHLLSKNLSSGHQKHLFFGGLPPLTFRYFSRRSVLSTSTDVEDTVITALQHNMFHG